MAIAKETIKRKGTVVRTINVCPTNNLNGGVAEFIARGEIGIQTIYYIIIIRGDYANLLLNEKKKPIVLKAKTKQCTIHIFVLKKQGGISSYCQITLTTLDSGLT